MNIVIQLPEYVHVMVLARVMVLAYDIGPRLACVIVLACVMVLACVIVLVRAMSPLHGSHSLSA